jgi:hypothetical protein
MTRIDFTAPLFVTDAEDRHVIDWPTLNGFVGRAFVDTDILRFFGESIDEVPVAVLLDGSGDIQILSNPQCDGVLARSSLRSSRALTADELETLRNHVEGEWSDGVGEDLNLDGYQFFIDLDRAEHQQIDDGITSQGSGTRDLFPAIHAGDVDRVRAAIADGENVLAVLGGTTALGWAIAFADAAIAHLLIDRGADVYFRENGMETVLVSCAASRDFSDADAASVVERLLAMGGFEPAEIVRAAEIAAQRGKKQLLAVLTSGPLRDSDLDA